MRRRASIAGRPDLPRPYNLFGPVGRRNAKQKLSYLQNRGVPPPLIELLAPFADEARGRDLLWFSVQLDRAMARVAPDLNAMRATEQEMLGAFPDMLDWLLGTRPNYSGMTWNSALQRSAAWHQAMADKRPRDKRMKTRNVVMTLPDNWAWVEIPFQDMRTEGELMGHCVGRGTPQKDRKWLSLRDPWNRPHVTMDAKWSPEDGWTLGQVKGKGNKVPIKVYAQLVLEFLSTHPLGPSLKLNPNSDIYRVLTVLYGDSVEKRDQAVRLISPAASIKTRAKMTQEIVAPESVLASMTRRRPSMIPVVYSHLPVKEMLRRMEKSRSMARVLAWARAAVNRTEELSKMRQTFGERRLVGQYFDYEKWAQALADDLGLPLPASATPKTLARMRRKARSEEPRERRVAALVLPPTDLPGMIMDPDPAVRSILSLRLEDDDAIRTVLLKHGLSPTEKRFTPGAVTPGWDEGVLVWRLSDKGFKELHRAYAQWHRLHFQVRAQIIARAAWHGMDTKLSREDQDCNTYQLITQASPLDKTAPYIAKFYDHWFGSETGAPGADEPEFEGWGSLDDMIGEPLLSKWAVAAPMLWADMYGNMEHLEEIPQWLYGRPPKWAKGVMKGVERARANFPWEEFGMGEYISGEGPDPEEEGERASVACGSVIEPLYIIARKAGLSDRKAWAWAMKLWSLEKFAEERVDRCRELAREAWEASKKLPARSDALHGMDIERPWQRQ